MSTSTRPLGHARALAQELGLYLQRGRRVAVVLTGGNVDASTLATVLAGRTPAH